MSKIGKSIAIWYANEIYGGDPEKIVARAKELGLTAIMPKIGNGQRKWQGLEPLCEHARAEGLEVWGWWYFYGYANEGNIAAEHATHLGCDMLIEDVEGHFDRSETNKQNLAPKARTMQEQLRAGFDGKLALCSWWKPSAHITPIETILANCDLNMPQAYWMGRYAATGSYSAASLIDECIDEYSRLYRWPTSKTAPIMAAFGQKVWSHSRGEWVWWETSVPQMDAANQRAQELGCIGATWWSWNHIMGKSGNTLREPRPAFAEAIGSYEWGGQQEPAPPEEPAPGADLTEEIAALETAGSDIATVIESLRGKNTAGG